MTEIREFKTSIIEDVFDINGDIEVPEEEINYLFSLEDFILESFKNHGEEGFDNVRGEVADNLLRLDYKDLMNYLGIIIPKSVTDSIDKRLTNKDFFTIEESEQSDDFFKSYLIDDAINDLIYNLLGYDRKSVGVKEVFSKKRAALIPTGRIVAIKNIFIALFNKTNFLSSKEDPEQAALIMMAYKAVFDIVLEIPYTLCDTQKTIEVLNMVALKLSNLIGLSKDFRKDFLDAVKESVDQQKRLRDREAKSNDD